MTRRIFFALAPLGLAMSTYACGGADGTPFTAGDDGGLPDATTAGDALAPPAEDAGADAAATTDGNARPDANTGADAGKDAAAIDGATPDGGTPPGPNKVPCGQIDCTLPATCCLPTDGGFGTCAIGGACNGLQRECDEAADCPQAPEKQVCCYEITPAGLSSSCHADCAGGGGSRVQACRVLGECLTGTCAVHACLDGGSVETCKPVPNICP